MVRTLSLVLTTKEFCMNNFWNDDGGVVISGEIVLISTTLVLGMIVGLTDFQYSIIAELQDLACAFGNFDQSYQTSGIVSFTGVPSANNNVMARTYGASNLDFPDAGDCNSAIIVCNDTGEQQPGAIGNSPLPGGGSLPGGFNGGFN